MDGTQTRSKDKFNALGRRCEKSRFKARMKSGAKCFLCTVSIFFSILFSGCGSKFFDPTQVGRFRPVPAVNVILDSLGVADETSVAWEQSEEPRPEDTKAVDSDYVFRKGDVITVAIYELFQEGVQFVNNYVVSETGRISIPEVGIIEAVGLTETQLEEKIKQILLPGMKDVLKDPSVIVTLAGSQQRAFSILGDGVLVPGRYSIPRYDFRLTEALATAGGSKQFNASYIYVSRFARDNKKTEYESPESELGEFKLEAVNPGNSRPTHNIQPDTPSPVQYQNQWPQSKVVITSSEMATDLESEAMERKFDPRLDTSRKWVDTGTGWRPSERLSEPQTDEQVSVQDILETLEERRLREQRWLNSNVDVEDALYSFKEIVRSENLRQARDNNRDTMRLSPTPAGPRTINGSEGTNNKWEMLDERRRLEQQWLKKPPGGVSGVRNAMESFREMVDSEQIPDERVNNRDVRRLSPTHTETEFREEPLDVKDVLKTLDERSGREQQKHDRQMDSLDRGNARQSFQELTNSGNHANFRDNLPNTMVPSPEKSGTEFMDKPSVKDEPGRIEWVLRNGNWVPVPVGSQQLANQSKMPKSTESGRPVIRIGPGEEPVGPFEQVEPTVSRRESGSDSEARLIIIPTDKLLAGLSRYNIVIKPGDTIFVPVDSIGEFYITGNVNRTGAIPITGRPMTLKMAIAAAGGLGPLAWPKNCEVIRRIGKKKEEIVMVDYDKIASGEQPDFFIKPNDLINVGSHPTARWRAILRNAFRATYGFGFVYDRNFADRDFGTHRPFPGWF